MSIRPERIAQVRHELERRTQDVVVLLAVESGSRASCFASQDSDYDVRFLYLRRPSWYLSTDLETRPDVLEFPISDGLDMVGWDLRKALRLLRKNNPPLLEWLRSPVTYVEATSIPDRLRRLAEAHFSATTSLFHYLQMARGNFREYLQGEKVWRKKYFYVLRPLLAMRWLERHASPVPMEFETLLESCLDPGPLRDAIRELLDQKRAGVEMDRGPKVPLESVFLAEELHRFEAGPGPLDPGRLVVPRPAHPDGWSGRRPCQTPAKRACLQQCPGRRGPMFRSLAPSFLLATPTLLDPNFSQTVVLLFAHSAEGAMGLVINRPAPEVLRKVLEATGLPNPGEPLVSQPVFLGGPVQIGSGWVIFRGEDPRGESFPAGEDLRVTGSQRVFRDLLRAPTPPTLRFCLGYAGWAPDQLESEIREGAWMTAPVQTDLVFKTPPDQCWRQAWMSLGIDPALWSFSIGDG